MVGFRIGGTPNRLTTPVLFADGTAPAPSISFGADPDTGFFRATSNIVDFASNGGAVLRFYSGGLHILGSLSFGGGIGSLDTFLVRDAAANILAMRNSTSAQLFRIYNTYTDASNYERGFARWASNVFEIGTEAAGTGSARDVRIVAGVATPAGGSTAARLLFGTTAGFGVYYGSGAPTVSAAQGSIYLRSDGSSTATRLYVNTNGTTGWTNFTSAA